MWSSHHALVVALNMVLHRRCPVCRRGFRKVEQKVAILIQNGAKSRVDLAMDSLLAPMV